MCCINAFLYFRPHFISGVFPIAKKIFSIFFVVTRFFEMIVSSVSTGCVYELIPVFYALKILLTLKDFYKDVLRQILCQLRIIQSLYEEAITPFSVFQK